jgi:rhodanese-related sulfurtransferase
MKKLPLILLIGFVSFSFGYDKDKAMDKEKFFSTFTDENVSSEMHLLCPSKLLKRVELGENFFFVDIRTKAEREILPLGFPNKLEVSFSDLFKEENLNKLPTNTTVVVVCESGVRAIAASFSLREIGFKNSYVMTHGVAKLAELLSPSTAPKN